MLCFSADHNRHEVPSFSLLIVITLLCPVRCPIVLAFGLCSYCMVLPSLQLRLEILLVLPPSSCLSSSPPRLLRPPRSWGPAWIDLLQRRLQSRVYNHACTALPLMLVLRLLYSCDACPRRSSTHCLRAYIGDGIASVQLFNSSAESKAPSTPPVSDK